MEEFLKSLAPSTRQQVEQALDGDATARSRLQILSSRYITDEGRWPTGPTAEMLARQFLREQGRWTEVTHSSAGLKAATAGALAGGVSVGAAKGSVVLSSRAMALYWQDVVSYAYGINPVFVRGIKKVLDITTEGTRWEHLARDLTAPSGPTDLQILFGNGLEQMFMAEMAGIVKQAAWRGTRSALNHYAGGSITDFSGENPWVESYVDRLARSQSHLASRTIHEIVRDGLTHDRGNREIADRLKNLWSLTPEHARAVENYRRQLDMPAGRAKSLANRYADRLRAWRIGAMSETESLTAFNIGREVAWQQAVQRGDLPLGTRKMWVTAKDEDVCPICKPLDGDVVPLGEAFLSTRTILLPTAHPHCRCLVIPVEPTVADQSRERLVFPSKQEVAKHLGGSSGKGDHPSGTPQSIHSGHGVENLMESIVSVRSGKFSLRPNKEVGGKKTPGMERQGDAWAVMIDVMHEDDKKPAGQITFTLRDDKTAYLDWFTLDPKYQAGGFGREIFDVGMKALKEAGVKQAKMEANIDVGGYAWAVMGFDFDPDPPYSSKAGLQERSLRRRVNYFKEHGYAYFGVKGRVSNWYGRKRGTKASAYTDRQREQINRQLDDMLERGEKHPVGHPKAPTVQEIASLGREHRWKHDRGFSLWPGKEILLGSAWDGVMDLDQVSKTVSQWDRVLAWMEDAEFVDASDLARDGSDYNLHARVTTSTPEHEDRLWGEVGKHLGGESGEEKHPSGTPQTVHAGSEFERDLPWDVATWVLTRGEISTKDELVTKMRRVNAQVSKPLFKKRNGKIIDFPTSKVRFMIEGTMLQKTGFRFGNENRIKEFANRIIAGENVFQYGGRRDPILVLVYDDGAQMLDGHHRLAAAQKAGLKKVPIQVARIRTPTPTPETFGQKWAELRRNLLRWQTTHEELPKKRREPFDVRSPYKVELAVNEWMATKGALRDERRFEELGVTRGKRPPIWIGKFRVDKHLLGQHEQKDHGRRHARREHVGLFSSMEPLFSTSDDQTLFRDAYNKAKETNGWWASTISAQRAVRFGKTELSRQAHEKRQLNKQEMSFVERQFEDSPVGTTVAGIVGTGLIAGFTRNPAMAREWMKWTARAARAGRVSPRLSKPWQGAFAKRSGNVPDEVMDDIRKIFDGDFGKLVSKTEHANISHGVIKASGHVTTKRGDYAGHWSRSFSKSGEVHHDLLEVTRKYQGSGFARDFYAQSMSRYKDIGFDRVSILADIDVGGYAWASRGFQFQPGAVFTERMAISLMAPRVMRQHPGRYTMTEVIGAQTRSMLPGTSPRQISQIGRSKSWTDSNGIEHWLGKDMMLGTFWHAMKSL